MTFLSTRKAIDFSIYLDSPQYQHLASQDEARHRALGIYSDFLSEENKSKRAVLQSYKNYISLTERDSNQLAYPELQETRIDAVFSPDFLGSFAKTNLRHEEPPMDGPGGFDMRSYLQYQNAPSGSLGNISTASSSCSSPPGTPAPPGKGRSPQSGGKMASGGKREEEAGKGQRRVQTAARKEQSSRPQKQRQSQSAQHGDAAQSARARGRERPVTEARGAAVARAGDAAQPALRHRPVLMGLPRCLVTVSDFQECRIYNKSFLWFV